MKLLHLLLFTVVLAMPFAQADEWGVLEIADNHKVAFKYHPAEQGEETLVLLNGLIYALENWDEYYNELKRRGFGVLLLSYSTQPESLRQLDGQTPYYAETKMTINGIRQKGLEISTLVDEAVMVVDKLGIDKFHLQTLSFGSIPGSVLANQYIDRVKNLILVAPAVMPSHRYNAYGASRHAHYMLLPDYYDYFYDVELYNTMYPMILAQGKPAGVTFLDFFHGVYQMARSTKWFDLKDMAEVELPPTHLFLASREDPLLYQDQVRFWELMDENPAKKSMVLFEGAPHALTGVVPKKAADMTEKVIYGEIRKSKVSVETGEKTGSSSGSDESGSSDESAEQSQHTKSNSSDDCMMLLESVPLTTTSG